jgi:arginase
MPSLPLSLLDAPSNLGLSPPPGRDEPGCRRSPVALRAAGLLAALGADDAGSVPAPAYTPDRDDTRTRNGRAIAAYATALAARMAALLAERWPVVVGGDCSILLGSLLALRRTGSAGLLFVDGHLDFRHPGIAPTGAVAGEDLALATGRGHPALADLEKLGPLVRDQAVVAIGNSEWDAESLPALDTDITVVDAEAITRRSATAVMHDALELLRRRDVGRVWLHVDVDVLDATIMPAVDSPNEAGLGWGDLTELIARAVCDPLVVGMEVTVFDPDLDPDGHLAAQLVRMLRDALRSRS